VSVAGLKRAMDEALARNQRISHRLREARERLVVIDRTELPRAFGREDREAQGRLLSEKRDLEGGLQALEDAERITTEEWQVARTAWADAELVGRTEEVSGLVRAYNEQAESLRRESVALREALKGHAQLVQMSSVRQDAHAPPGDRPKVPALPALTSLSRRVYALLHEIATGTD
jgi:hypothetical protein